MKYLRLYEDSNNDNFEDICYSIENLFIEICDKYDVRSNDYKFYRHKKEESETSRGSFTYIDKENWIGLYMKIPNNKVSTSAPTALNSYFYNIDELKNSKGNLKKILQNSQKG